MAKRRRDHRLTYRRRNARAQQLGFRNYYQLRKLRAQTLRGDPIPHNAPSFRGESSKSIPGLPSTSSFLRGAKFLRFTDIKGRTAGAAAQIQWTGLQELMQSCVQKGLDAHAVRRDAAEQLGKEMVEYAKANAPWQDRTGDARRTLRYRVQNVEAQRATIVALAHGVYYGVYLETMQMGDFAIVGPTVQHFAARVNGIIRDLDPMGKPTGLSMGQVVSLAGL